MDFAQLERRSLGDARLKVELLSLFELELERLVRQLLSAPDAHRRGERLNAIAVAAGNIGAMRLAAAARRAEAQAGSQDPDFTEIAEAAHEVLAYLRRPGA